MQLDLFHTGEMLAEEGLNRAVDKSEADHPGWKERTWELFKEFLSDQTGPFMVEDFRSFLAMLPDYEFPNSSRAFGFISKRAVKEGLIEFAGHGKVRNVKAHAATAARWIKK